VRPVDVERLAELAGVQLLRQRLDRTVSGLLLRVNNSAVLALRSIGYAKTPTRRELQPCRHGWGHRYPRWVAKFGSSSNQAGRTAEAGSTW